MYLTQTCLLFHNPLNRVQATLIIHKLCDMVWRVLLPCPRVPLVHGPSYCVFFLFYLACASIDQAAVRLGVNKFHTEVLRKWSHLLRKRYRLRSKRHHKRVSHRVWNRKASTASAAAVVADVETGRTKSEKRNRVKFVVSISRCIILGCDQIGSLIPPSRLVLINQCPPTNLWTSKVCTHIMWTSIFDTTTSFAFSPGL